MLIAFLMSATLQPQGIGDVAAARRDYHEAEASYAACLRREAVRLGGDTNDDAAVVLSAARAGCSMETAELLLSSAALATVRAIDQAENPDGRGLSFPNEVNVEQSMARAFDHAALALLEHRRSRRGGVAVEPQ